VFGLDALSSAAYGPEATLTLLIPLSATEIAYAYIVPISASIIVLLTIVYFSYRQAIQAYSGGGGSYTVARQSLGASAGLLAAPALMIDYVLVGRRGHIRRSGSTCFRGTQAPAVDCLVVSGDSRAHHRCESSGCPRIGTSLHFATYLFVGSLAVAPLPKFPLAASLSSFFSVAGRR
jgi:amino acid transporter